MQDPFPYKTEPFRHQRDVFHHMRALIVYILWWEQGVGKTKPTIDNIAWLYLEQMVDAALIIAPSGVQRNWANDQIPEHMPDCVAENMAVYVYESGKAGTKKAERAREALLRYEKGLRVLCMSYDAIMTPKGWNYAKRFMSKYRCIGVADESQMFKTAKSKTAKRMVAVGRRLKYRRCLSGTPITHGPFDVYKQIEFADEEFWERHHLAPYEVFKTYFGVWITAEQFREDTGIDVGYPQLVDYKHLDKLSSYVHLVGHRLTKKTAGIELPPKLYTKRHFDLTPKQRAVYDELVEEYVAELPDTGDVLEAPQVIVRLTRLQQIVCGYVACEADDPVQMIDKRNPRLDLLLANLDEYDDKAIIWSKFTPDIDMIMAALGKRAVRYDGKVSEDDRERNKIAFQQGDAQFFVAKPQSGATGLTLHAAKSVHYYSNSYNYGHRAQSEDRAHRIGLKHPVLYVDYVANGTVDENIVRNLLKKDKLAATVLRDEQREWIK